MIMKHNTSWTVLSIGGSLVVPPEGIDVEFLKALHKLLLSEIKKGKKFAVVVGGGSVCRKYQQAAGEIGTLTRDDLDWLGIHATRLNGHLLRTIFRDIAHPRVFKNPHQVPQKSTYPLLVAAGWKPGWSTDYVAVCLAKRLGANQVLNFSNIDFVYTADPRKDPKAKAIPQMTWKEFRALIGGEWKPGMNSPFDPIASRLAARAGIEVAILNGKNIANVQACLHQKKFVGTRIAS